MQNALNALYYIFDKFVDLIFNDLAIENGVTIGWIAFVCVVFAILLGSIVAIPRSAQRVYSAGDRKGL